jgi:aldose 1-epimerase
MVAPSGDQFEISWDGYRAVVTECGAGLRELEYDGRPLVLGFPEERTASSGRGQLLAPWPNRVAGATYTFEGTEHRPPVDERERGNAIHGLVRWAAWTPEEMTTHSASLVLRLMARPGYPWTLDLHALYDLSADGLTVTVTATNLSPAAAPYALGAHPYLVAGPGRLDDWELTLPAATRLVTDDRMIPTGCEDVRDTDLDFRMARPLRNTAMDTAFTDLTRGSDGRVEVQLRDPAADQGVALWADAKHSYLQLFTGDALPAHARESLAVEPMTSPPNAFNSGESLVVLSPAGSDGDEHSASWGIRAL